MKPYFSNAYKKMLVLIIISSILYLSLSILSLFISKKLDYIILGVIFFGFLITIRFHIYLYKKFLSQQLDLITNILKKNDKEAIIKLQKSSKKFALIGDLFLNNTEQKENLQKAKEKAEESETLKSSFLTNLSHEIRTPMNAIIGFSDLLSSEELSEPEKAEYIEVIKRSGKNLVSIIDDLIEMSKIDTNQVEPNFSEFDLDLVLNSILQIIEITIPKDKPVKVFIDKPKYPIIYQLISDETKLRQIIINLLNNAVKYTEKGSVNFGYTVNPNDNSLEFYIKDTGIGISEDKLESIFNRFNRIQNDKTINISGLGLGLAISKAYIEMLGGRIWVNSMENTGTTFFFSIPLKLNASPTKPFEEIKQRDIDQIKPLTILVAEDDEINFMLINRIMKIRNYTVIRARNGEQAVSICKENTNIQLVIMDIKMPKISGFEARKLIREFKPYLPIIAHTAHSSEINSKIYDAGFIDCISKPLDKNKLFKIIDRIEHLTPN